MKMLKRLIPIIFIITTIFTTISMNTFATEYTDKGNAYATINKPHLTMGKIILSQSEAIGKTIKVNLNISGANLAYAPTSLHIYWDSLLKLANNKHNPSMIKHGSVTQSLSEIYERDYSNTENGMDDYFSCTTRSGNLSANDVTWLFRKNMQVYVFIKDIYSSNNPIFTAPFTDIAKVSALANTNKTSFSLYINSLLKHSKFS